ncbi:MAG: prephenate dehydratase [Chloroflexi bacterium]|nr:prephenate dehydratase [Chloroflexota bacterium]
MTTTAPFAADSVPQPDDALGRIRWEIDEIDRRLIELLNRRAAASVEVARVKRSDGTSTYVPSREQDVLDNVRAANRGPLQEEHVRAIYAEILSASRALQRPLRIAYLGPERTFSHRAAESAARVRFGSFVEYLPARTVDEVFSMTERGNADYGVVPVENSTEGSVGQTLDLFVDSSLKICAEILLSITHHLIGRGPLDEVERVYSHPQALGQCRRWLIANLPTAETVESSSTAAAAQRAAEARGTAAIGTEEAAAQYGLSILARAIQDQAHNVTRFLLIGRQIGRPSGHDKTSILFAVRDRVGALHDVLSVFARRKINLTRIESRPSRRQPWEYVFFVDFAGHPDESNAADALAEMSEVCTTVKVLGAWPTEQRVDSHRVAAA